MQFETSEDDESPGRERAQAADNTHRLVGAIKALTKKDFSTMTGSGLVFSITDMAGNYVCPEFLLRAEDMETIKHAFIKTLKDQLKFRKILREAEIRDIAAVITDPEP